jgi:carboxymethylenebutenolidase
MKINRWVPPALLALTVACGPAAEDDFLARMAEEHRDDSPETGAADREAPASQGAEVTYARLDDSEIAGYLARPAEPGGSAVLVIHEWWGLNDNIRAMARRLADEGHLALAVDLYEGEVAEDRDTARKLATRAREQTARGAENMRQALAYLRDELGAERVGVIGWCFGGGWSLATALDQPDGIDATVIYYGRLVTDPAALAPLASPVLGIFGELDGGIPVETVRQFEATLAELGKRASIHVYEGADHAFANPTGNRYQAAAAEDAWAKTVAFFAEHLG